MSNRVTPWLLLLAAQLQVCANVHLMPADYVKSFRPNMGGEAVGVNASIFITSFGPVDSADMTAASEIYFRTSWIDPRLRVLYRDIKQETQYPANYSDFIYLGGEYYTHVWKPDVYFPDAVSMDRPIVEEDDSVFLGLLEDGRIIYSVRLMLKTRCRMTIENYPFDKQNCPICVSQYKYPVSEQNLRWALDYFAIEVSDNLYTSHFAVDQGATERSLESSVEVNLFHSFPRLCVKVHFSRHLMMFIFTCYLPSFILVALAFVSFWIDHKSVPARVSLAITTILAQITLITGVAMKFPSGSTLRLIDIYLSANFTFTFCTMLEFALVSYSARPSPSPQLIPSSPPQGTRLPTKRSVRSRISHCDLDAISRVFFPLVFGLFNAVYGLYCISIYL